MTDERKKCGVNAGRSWTRPYFLGLRPLGCDVSSQLAVESQSGCSTRSRQDGGNEPALCGPAPSCLDVPMLPCWVREHLSLEYSLRGPGLAGEASASSGHPRLPLCSCCRTPSRGLCRSPGPRVSPRGRRDLLLSNRVYAEGRPGWAVGAPRLGGGACILLKPAEAPPASGLSVG